MDLVSAELPAETLVVAVDPGKVFHRVLLASGERGLIGEPVSLPVGRDGIEQFCRLVEEAGAARPVIALETTGSLHTPWATELERLFPGSLRLFAPSETHAARTSFGSRRIKTDDRDCAALVSLARQGCGRLARDGILEAMLDAVRRRRRLVLARRVARQHLHHQLNSLCPGLSAPPGHGRVLEVESVSGQAVLACAVEFGGRALRRGPCRPARRDAWRGEMRSSGRSAGAACSGLPPMPS